MRQFANHRQKRMLFWRVPSAREELCEFYPCRHSGRNVRFMQDENGILAPTKPPAITIFALIYLSLLLGHKNTTKATNLRS